MLFSAHFLADFSLQPKYMIEDKMKGDAFGYLTLIGHCFTHAVLFGLVLAIVTPHWLILTTFVFLTHFVIDTGKINHLYNVWVDQFLHYGVIILCRSLI